MKVQKKTIQKWCDALRSGEYEQGRGKLQSGDNEFCCLGVACKTFIPNSALITLPDCALIHKTPYLSGALPSSQTSSPLWLLEVNDDLSYLTGKTLSSLNDIYEYNFNEIADTLEAVYIHKVLS
jgi:hypothetical protein